MMLPGLWSFAQEEAVSWHSPWCQSLQYLPICYWFPSSCCPGAESQREWVYVSPKSFAGSLGGVSWGSHSFFCHPRPHWFLQAEVMGTYLPGTLSWVVWSGAGIPRSRGIPPNFHPRHMDVRLLHSTPLHMSLPLLPVWMNVASLNPWLSDFHTAWFSNDSEWFLFCSLVSFFCSYVRRWGVFTYASILTRSSHTTSWKEKGVVCVKEKIISISGIVQQKPSCSRLNSEWKMRKWRQTSHSMYLDNKGRRKIVSSSARVL